MCDDAPPDPVPAEITIVGVDGGVVYGPDGITLEVEPGALATTTAFSIVSASATLEFENFTPTARLFTVAPSVTFSTSSGNVVARLVVPAAAPASGAIASTLFLRPTPPGPIWQPIALADDEGGFALDQTGTFGIGDEVTP